MFSKFSLHYFLAFIFGVVLSSCASSKKEESQISTSLQVLETKAVPKTRAVRKVKDTPKVNFAQLENKNTDQVLSFRRAQEAAMKFIENEDFNADEIEIRGDLENSEWNRYVASIRDLGAAFLGLPEKLANRSFFAFCIGRKLSEDEISVGKLGFLVFVDRQALEVLYVIEQR